MKIHFHWLYNRAKKQKKKPSGFQSAALMAAPLEQTTTHHCTKAFSK